MIQDPMEGLKRDLGDHIALGGIVACWITNSATTRARAMEIFEAWDVTLAEEWYWLKVTKDGRPVIKVGPRPFLYSPFQCNPTPPKSDFSSISWPEERILTPRFLIA